MSVIPSDLLYTTSHEWLRRNDDGTITVGITDYAQSQLGDLVFIESPTVGRSVTAGDACGTLESVKAASEVFSPLDGEVIEINTELESQPELINEDPYGAGWLFTVRAAAEPEGLLDAAAYQAHLKDLE